VIFVDLICDFFHRVSFVSPAVSIGQAIINAFEPLSYAAWRLQTLTFKVQNRVANRIAGH